MDSDQLSVIRSETPGLENVIHLNNAGASLMPQSVLETMTGYLELESEVGGYEAFDARREELDTFYGAAARLIGARPEEIAFAESATRAWQLAFYSLKFSEGDRILTSRTEYASNYISYLQMSRKYGVSVEPVPNDSSGQISIEELEKRLDERVRLVALTHIPTNSGLINPAEEVGRLLEDHPALYLLDACQSAGQLPLDAGKLGCDLLSATGRKYLRGPRGTGFLFVKKHLLESLEPVMLDMHSATWTDAGHYEMREDARRFENWEINFAGKLGLAEAIRYALDLGPEDCWKRIELLASKLREMVDGIEGAEVMDPGERLCGIVSIRTKDVLADRLAAGLREAGINVSVSPPDSTLLDTIDRGLDRQLRASVHYYNTEEELERFAEELAERVGR